MLVCGSLAGGASLILFTLGVGNTFDVMSCLTKRRCFSVTFWRRMYVFHSPTGTQEASGNSSTVAYTLDHAAYPAFTGGRGVMVGNSCWSGIPKWSDTVTTRAGKGTTASALVVTLMAPNVPEAIVVGSELVRHPPTYPK